MKKVLFAIGVLALVGCSPTSDSMLEKKIRCNEIWGEKKWDYEDSSEFCIEKEVHYSPKYDTCIYYENCTMHEGTHKERVYDILTNDLLFWTGDSLDAEFKRKLDEAVGK